MELFTALANESGGGRLLMLLLKVFNTTQTLLIYNVDTGITGV